MAVRGGFEPPMHFRTYTLSRRAPSTTRTSHHQEVVAEYKDFIGFRQAFFRAWCLTG